MTGIRRTPQDREDALVRISDDELLREATSQFIDAVLRKHDHEAISELRKINELLKENGFSYPLGARGVEDLIFHQGVIQFFGEEAEILLRLIETSRNKEIWPGVARTEEIIAIRDRLKQALT